MRHRCLGEGIEVMKSTPRGPLRRIFLTTAYASADSNRAANARHGPWRAQDNDSSIDPYSNNLKPRWSRSIRMKKEG
jgi:hypothetical protein